MTTKPGFSSHSRVRNRRRLLWTVLLTGVTFIAEAVGGLLTNSLALLSDAGHMFTHLLALGVSYLAVLFSQRPATERRTYGLNRLEILAALFNGATLLAISIGISYEAYRRLLEPLPIATGPVLVIAVVGLVVNLIGALILSGAEHKDLNVRGAFIHLLTDTFSSVAVIVGVLIISLTGWTLIDPLLSVVICVVILFWALRLIWDSVDILLEATPRDVNMQGVLQGLRQIPGIRDVHHLHVWCITSRMYALSAHVDVDDLRVSQTERLAQKAEAFLRDQFNINHATFQFECQSGRTVDEVLSGINIATNKGGTDQDEKEP